MNELILQLHGGKGGSSTTVQSYQPTDEEKRLWQLQGDFQENLNPYSMWLADTSQNMLEDSLGAVKVDYSGLNNVAQQQLGQAQQGVSNLANGVLPSSYQQNMEDSIRSGVQNTMGQTINSLGNRGVLNSSVTNTALNDISKNVSDTMAQQYGNNVSILNGLYGQQASLASQPITVSAAAQEGAQAPAISLLNAALGGGASTTGAISSLSGTGTTTSTQQYNTGMSPWVSGLLGAGSSLGSAAITACFVGNTLIDMADGSKKIIADIKVGDEVMSLSNGRYTTERVIGVSKPRKISAHVIVCVDEENVSRSVSTTITQPLMRENGELARVVDLKPRDELMNVGEIVDMIDDGLQTVYDFKTTGDNIYFANSFVAYGAYDEELI